MSTYTKYLFLFAVLVCPSMILAQSQGVASVVINEIDSDNAGIDTMEFVELYGDPNTPLDGLTVVFFNGSDTASYVAVDLDGVITDANGFALVGNAAVPGVDATFANGALQNGPDAVAVVEGDADDYPNDTPINLDVIIDAVVYVTDDLPENGLMILLEEGQVEVNESGLGNSSEHALARIPDGGLPQITETYVQQIPTPGYSNVLQCEGGVVSVEGDQDAEITVCADEIDQIVEFQVENSVDEDNYMLIVCDINDQILFTESELSIDFYNAPFGECRVYGCSYTGELDMESISAGMPISGVFGTECSSISVNFMLVTKENCGAPTCEAGMVQLQDGSTTAAICVNAEDAVLFFEQITDEEFVNMTFIIATPDGVILDAFDDEEYDFFDAPEGTCHIYGFAYLGELDEESVAAGELLENANASECYNLTENFVTMQKLECTEDGGCLELFFSEYIEGSSQNKAIEIYNPTPFPVELTPYVMSTYNNGNSTPTNQLNMTGTLQPGDVYIICHSDAAPAILNEADQTAAVSWFNGNDVLALYNDGVLVDIMGVIGEDPGLAFDVNGVTEAMAEHTLVRNILVTEGTTDWSQGNLQWDVYPLNTFDFIGEHNTVPCNFEETPSITFTTETVFMLEGNSIDLNIDVAFPISDIQATVTLDGGTATPDVDFVNDMPFDLLFPNGDLDPQTITVTSIDDEEAEGQETIELLLTAISEDVEVLIAELTIVILASDIDIPVYNIAEVHTEETDGIADSLDVVCELRGIVHGTNTNPGGIQFTLIDETGGIGVYDFISNFGYTVTEGDSVHVIGTVDQFNGLTQIEPDTILLQASGLPLTEPMLFGEHNEDTESILVQLKCVELVDPTQWTNEEPGFNVDVTTGTQEFTMRIDSDVDVFGQSAPLGVFNVNGIGGQFDSSSPFDEGYQFLPRYSEDISEPVFASFTAPSTYEIGTGDIVFDNQSDNADSFFWTFGDNTESEETNPTHQYDEPGVYTVTLTAYNEELSCDHTVSWEIDVLPNNIQEQDVSQLNVFPNPNNGSFMITGFNSNDQITLFDASGRVIEIDRLRRASSELTIEGLSKGVYFIQTRSSQGVKVARVVVQ